MSGPARSPVRGRVRDALASAPACRTPDPAPPPPGPSNLPHVLGLYRALTRRDWIEIQQRVSADVILSLDGGSEFAGTYRGTGAVLALVARLEEHLVPGDSTLADIRDEGATVRAAVTVSLRRRSGGEDLRAQLHETFRFDREGLIVEVDIAAADQEGLDAFLGR